uniref:DAAF9 N-terminal domain-containing protein n=1 Tax=Ciona savignyi TaxID=51511 RepID=H2YKK3_CIOSA
MKKRPSSAKRSIQQQSFSPYLSCKRLRNVQSLLPVGSEDSIVVILGIDSRYNEGCRELANYLLFDFYDLRLNQLEEYGLPEEDLDDLVIVIRHSTVQVYCSPTLYNYLLPYIGHWMNLTIHSLHEDSTQSEVEQEEYKIVSFISMVESSHHIGIPYYVGTSHSMTSQFDKFAVEKWPLIQSTAWDDMGGGGFFTMVHEVSDIRDSLLPIYHQLDPASLEQMIVRSLPLFIRHWGECMSNIMLRNNGDSSSIVDYDVTE